MTPFDIMLLYLGDALIPGRRYLSDLPPELEQWYCYAIDTGHSILSLIEDHYESESGPLHAYACTVPVKTVLRAGWRTEKGSDGLLYVVTKAEYSEDLGLITEPDDEEF